MTKKYFRILAALLIMLSFLSSCGHASPAQTAQGVTPLLKAEPFAVRMLVLNVGKADAIIIEAGDYRFLIDAATSKRYDQVAQALKTLGIDRLDAVFLTHTDKDHGGGLKKLSDSDIEVGAWYASAYYVDKTYDKHQAVVAAGRRGESVTFLKSGDDVVFSDEYRFEVVGPVTLIPDSENNNSLAMILYTPQGNLMLTGDMQIQEELMALKTQRVVSCEVLKVGHHGDNTASGFNFISVVRPQIAVISTSTQEERDTPSGEVLLALRGVGAQTFVTQNAGDGVLVTLKDKIATAEHVSIAP